jgi:hypothetical protein
VSVSGTITATLSDTLKVSLNEAVTVAALVIVAKMCVKRLTSCSTVGVNFKKEHLLKRAFNHTISIYIQLILKNKKRPNKGLGSFSSE